jgi:signal transduction histidine kinase
LAVAERQWAVDAQAAVAEERRRIARELHDIVAHSLGLITIHAAAAHKLMTHDPARAQRALDSIDDLGRQGAEELQRLLGVLRTEAPSLLGPPGDDNHSGADSLPSFSDADAVLANMSNAGLHLRTEVKGRPGRLDPSVDSTAFRVLQESLTNVLKHAGRDATASVVTRWNPDHLVLEITSWAPQPPPSGSVHQSGYGLVGLRERAAAVGGQLTAARLPTDQFQVIAVLPRPREATLRT